MNIYLDCDEVLLNTAIAHVFFLKKHYGVSVDPHIYPSCWSFRNEKIKSYEVSTSLFTHSEEFSKVSPVPFAKEGIEVLKKQKHKLFVVTSISDCEEVKKRRKDNLEAVFGPVFENITCLPLGHNNKRQYYENVEPGVVIDDSFHNILLALECGHIPVFVSIRQNQEWLNNVKQKNILSITNLKSFAEVLPCIQMRHEQTDARFLKSKYRERE